MDQPLNILVLVGSLRRAGYARAIAAALPGLAPEGMTIIPAPSIADLPHYDEDVQAKGWPAGVVALDRAMREADALLIVSPEYNHSVPGVLKNALDWVSRVPPSSLANKAVAFITHSPGSFGGIRCQEALRPVFGYFDAVVLPRPELGIGMVHAKVDVEAGTITDEKTADRVRELLAALAAFSVRLRGA